MNNKILTQEDVLSLMNNKSDVTKRAEITTKLAKQIELDLTPQEKEHALTIIQAMANDTAVLIRKTLAENIKASKNIPKELAIKLAMDVEEVSLPIVEFSTLLSDEDLIQIIESGNSNKQIAVAKRKNISNTVAGVLIETNNEEAVAALVDNDTANLREENYARVIQKYGHSELVKEKLVRKPRFSAALREELMSIVSDKLKKYLMDSQQLDESTAENLVVQTREKATIKHISSLASSEEVQEMVRKMVMKGRLTPSIVLRAICLGDITFFEHAIATLAQIPLHNAKIIIHDGGKDALETLLKKANFGADLIPAIKVAIEVRKETDFDGEEDDIIRFRRKMIERILTQYENLGQDNLNFLLTKFSDLVNQQQVA